ncbi:MAG TPA: hypothetical protein VFO59_04620, partial [Dehalococcoidia bacterium]|nr:hypothetical protein [Dehalococcoidia bacterium]
MKRLFSALALAAMAALLWQSATPARACSCAMGTAKEWVSEADTIVLGRVDDARLAGTEQYAGAEFARIQATLSVERYLKGSGADLIVVHELVTPCSVLHPSADGWRHLLFLQGSEPPFTLEGVCSGSSLIYGDGDISPESASESILREQEQWLAGIRAVTGPGVAPVTNNAPALPLGIAALAIPL